MQYEQILDSLKNMTPPEKEGLAQAAPPQPQKQQPQQQPKEAEKSADNSLARVEGSFEIPHLMFELLGRKDSNVPRRNSGSSTLGRRKTSRNSSDQGLVCLKFNEFAILFEKKEALKNTFEVTLGSLVMEDMTLGAESPHRVLATSISKDRGKLTMLISLTDPLSYYPYKLHMILTCALHHCTICMVV